MKKAGRATKLGGGDSTHGEQVDGQRLASAFDAACLQHLGTRWARHAGHGTTRADAHHQVRGPGGAVEWLG